MPSEEKSLLKTIGVGLMGFGQGMTGQPYLTNYQNIQADAQRAKMQRDLEQQKMEADIIGRGNYPIQPGGTTTPQGYGGSVTVPGVQVPQPNDLFTFGGKMYHKAPEKQSYVQAWTMGEDGQLRPIITPNNPPGMMPKGSKIVPTSTMQSSEDKIKEAVTKSELTSAAGILPKMDQAQEAVKMLKEQYYKGFTPMDVQKGDIKGGLNARISGIGQSAMSAVGANPDLNVYKSNRGAFASLISKGGFLEAGVLTNQDIERVLKAVPYEGSTKKEADTKWQEVEGILGKARQRYEKKFSSFTGGEEKSKNDDKYQQYLKLIGGAK